jgi:hypothetical protein
MVVDYVLESPVKDFEAQADAALEQIAADRATLADSPTNAQVIAVLDGVLQRQSKEVKVLRKLLRQFTRQ